MNHQRRKYSYSYDNQHRLTAAYYQLPGTVIPRSNSYSTSYSYDENGNISSLKRNGKEDDPNLLIEIDDLDYTYDQGNRLLKVKDATNNPSGFNMNGAGINAQYAYDDFGNLKTDPYKKISHISYNHLNLPVKITFTGGETIEYTYLADGTKLKKTAKDAESNTTTTEYRGGFQYKNNILEFFPHSEGYVKATEAVNGYIFNYVFTHTDHLGNIRVKYTKHPQTGDIQILEEDHYYPYGLTHEGYNGNHRIVGLDQPGTAITLIDVTPDVTDPYKYKFNGMEWQDEFDVNVYDFGARNYDPALGRWMNIDPLAEMMRRHSPYNYAFNNPVFFIDPDGMMAIPGALKGGLLVQDTNFLGVSDIFNGNMGSTASGESMAPERNNSAAYKNYFQQVSDYAANADESLGGGECPEGVDCDDNPLKRHEDKVKYNLKEWTDQYMDKSFLEIVTEAGWKQGQPLGPLKDWRYIKAPDGNVMDMRHVIIVGYIYGEVIGDLIERGQIYFHKESAKDPQDYYSNKIGAYFYQLRQSGSWKSDSWAYDFERFINTQYRTLFSD